MVITRSLRQRVRRHADLAELAAGMSAGVAVLALAILQWGPTDDGWIRGLTLGIVLGIAVVISVRRGRRMEEERERAASEQRLRIARDLHDAVASQVSIIGIQAAAGRRMIADDPPRAAAALDVIEEAARTANADLRQMLAALRADATGAPPEHRGLAQIPALVGELRATGLRVKVSGSDRLPPLPPAVDTTAYRIVQESLANALAHAGAVHAIVHLSVEGQRLRIRVENEPGQAAVEHAGTGLGLPGMRERAELIGGRLESGPRPGGGYVVEATLPVSEP